MKTSIKTKKGFTVVELVIVIAVIAILAAVLIPTFVNLVNKANVSADVQLVRNLNTALALDKAENGKHSTAYDAAVAVREHGFDITLIKPTNEGFYILWDSVNDVFCYAEDGEGKNVKYVPEDLVTKEATENLKPTDFYYVDSKSSEFGHNYSVLYTGSDKDVNIDDRNFDAGYTICVNVTYNGTDNAVIRMYGGELKVTNGTVTVYGFVGKLEDGSKVIAAKGTKFHQKADEVTSLQKDNGALYGEHLYGADNKCVLCPDGTASNPEHIHELYVEVDNESDQKYILINTKCKTCDYISTEKIEKNEVVIEIPGDKEIIIEEKECEHKDYSDPIVLTTADCTTPGISLKYCKKCGHAVIINDGEATGHNYVHKDGKAADCTHSGYTDYEQCANCQHIKNCEGISALGHDWETVSAKTATCTEDGYSEYQKCKREGCSIKQGYSEIKAAHKHGDDGFCINGECHHYDAIPEGAEVIEISGYSESIITEFNENDGKTYYYKLTSDVKLSVKEFIGMFGYQYGGFLLTTEGLYFDLNGYSLTVNAKDGDFPEGAEYGNIIVSNKLVFANGTLVADQFEADNAEGALEPLFFAGVEIMDVQDVNSSDNCFCIFNIKAICQRGCLISSASESYNVKITNSTIEGDWFGSSVEDNKN